MSILTFLVFLDLHLMASFWFCLLCFVGCDDDDRLLLLLLLFDTRSYYIAKCSLELAMQLRLSLNQYSNLPALSSQVLGYKDVPSCLTSFVISIIFVISGVVSMTRFLQIFNHMLQLFLLQKDLLKWLTTDRSWQPTLAVRTAFSREAESLVASQFLRLEHGPICNTARDF